MGRWGESPLRTPGTMPRSRTIKTKSDGVLPGRGRRRKRPLWCVQIVPSSRAMIRRHDLKGEKLDGRSDVSLISCHSALQISLQALFTMTIQVSESDSFHPCNFSFFVYGPLVISLPHSAFLYHHVTLDGGRCWSNMQRSQAKGLLVACCIS